MPIIHCSIDGCVGRKECSMHRFPDPRKNLDFFKKWIELCSNKNVVDMIPEKVYANRRVCNVHFKACDYVSNKVLKRTAYPSLNMPEIITEGETASLIPTGNIELPLNHIFLQTPDVNKPSSTSFNSSTSNDIPSTPVKNKCARRSLLLNSVGCSSENSLSPKKKILYRQILTLRKEARNIRNSKISFQERLKRAKKFSSHAIFNNMEVNQTARQFWECQVRNLNKKPKGRSFTNEDVTLALALYKQSGSAYRFLSKIFYTAI
ncbi:hypothetical protein FQA39_LY16489 [Lamprigera yunnana]|nr:hypothetical protein FQA39_LY16489 [Lamprigera yunnana]